MYVSQVVHIAAFPNKVSVTHFLFLAGAADIAAAGVADLANVVDLLANTRYPENGDTRPAAYGAGMSLSEDGASVGEKRKQDLFGRHRSREKEVFLKIVG
jgi:hypothetical protein